MKNKTTTKEISNKSSSLSIEFLISFAVMCVSYFLYMTSYMDYNTEIMKQITSLLNDMNMDSSMKILYVLYAVCMLILFFVGFVIYKVLFKLISCKVEEKKLLLSIMSAYAVSFIVGWLLIGNIPFIITTIICSVIEMFIVFAMNYDDIKKKIVPAFIIRSILIIINVIASFAN